MFHISLQLFLSRLLPQPCKAMLLEVGDLVRVLTHHHYDSREWRVHEVHDEYAVIGTSDDYNNLTTELAPLDELEVVDEWNDVSMQFLHVSDKDRAKWRRARFDAMFGPYRLPHILPALRKKDQEVQEPRRSSDDDEETSQRIPLKWRVPRGDLQHAIACGYVDDDTGFGVKTPRKRTHQVTHQRPTKSRRRWGAGLLSQPSTQSQTSSLPVNATIGVGEPL